jgi:hypothetical protein
MSERMSELLWQAGGYTKLDGSYSLHESHLQKFAELIVRECIKCCDEIDDINKTYREIRLVDPEFGPKECITTIKAHFGVEE